MSVLRVLKKWATLKAELCTETVLQFVRFFLSWALQRSEQMGWLMATVVTMARRKDQ